jgi:purine nucleosidase
MNDRRAIPESTILVGPHCDGDMPGVRMRTLPRMFVLLLCGFLGSVVSPISISAADAPPVVVRARVIVDNDFGGDPDGLFQLAHHLRSPSVEIRGIIGSRHYEGGFYGWAGSAAYSCEVAAELLEVMKLKKSPPIYRGAEARLKDSRTPARSEGAEFIVKEAMRGDTQAPLYVACGAGLTTVASAYLIEPKIAGHIRLIWIGGPEYPGLALPPPGSNGPEYNLGIDIKAAQVIFNQSDIPLWQLPRDAYRRPLVSYAELLHRVKSQGPAGAFLVGRLEELMKRAHGQLGEAYVLGDSPLVLLTALQSSWEADPSSSKYVWLPAPRINDAGRYEPNADGRKIRVYTDLDVRLLLEDFYAKLAL